jgi:hypothetical protein
MKLIVVIVNVGTVVVVVGGGGGVIRFTICAPGQILLECLNQEMSENRKGRGHLDYPSVEWRVIF